MLENMPVHASLISRVWDWLPVILYMYVYCTVYRNVL